MTRGPGDKDDLGRDQHSWIEKQCSLCGLRRDETWVLDEQGRAVLALIWSNHAGLPVRAIAFAWMRGDGPALQPRATLAQAFPGLATGREPTCRIDHFR